MNIFKPLLKLEMGRMLFFVDGVMDIFKSLLKQMFKQLHRLHYFMIYPDIMGADLDAIEDPLRRAYIEDPLRREYIKEVKRLMVNGEPIPDFVRVRHGERYPAVEPSPRERATRELMEKLARREKELLRSEKAMEQVEAVQAMVDRVIRERERRDKSRAGEGSGRQGSKSQAGGRGGRPKKKTNTG